MEISVIHDETELNSSGQPVGSGIDLFNGHIEGRFGSHLRVLYMDPVHDFLVPGPIKSAIHLTFDLIRLSRIRIQHNHA